MSPSPSRRDLLALGAAAPALGFVQAASRAATPGPDPHFAGFALGIQSYSLRGFGFDRALALTQQLGLHQVEAFPGHLPESLDAAGMDQLRKRMRCLELALSAWGVCGFGKDPERNRKLFEFANRLGIRNLTCDPDPEAMADLDKLVAEFGIRVAVHNHGPTHRYGRIADLQKLVDGHHRWVGVCIDTGHMIRAAQDPVQAIRALGPRVFGIHLKDFGAQRGDAPGVILGKGHLDVKGVFQALRVVDFPADGGLSLEYEEKETDPMSDLAACLEVAGKAAREVAAR